MKTLKNLLLIILLGASFSSFSQCLEIRGKFRDSKGHKITALYTLSSNGKVIIQGYASKLKQKLEMNQDYVLDVRQSSNVSRTIRFSTQSTTQEEFKFVFEVRLRDLTTEPVNFTKNIVVYYDNKLGTFTFSPI